MAEITFTLHHGLKVGEDVMTDVVLRELTAGDLLQAKEESEKLCNTPDGPQFVTSPTLMVVNVLRRQIVRIGNVQGPLDMGLLKTLTPRDLALLQSKSEELDSAFAQTVENMKRSDAGGR